MTEHPLTDEKVYGLIQPICEWAYEASMPEYDKILHGTKFDMEADRECITKEVEIATKIVRDAYDLGRDEQLEQVNDFFVNYRKAVMGANPGYIPSLTELLSLMNQAMRPTTTTTTQEDNS